MKLKMMATMALLVSGCGFSSADNELVGQPKKIHRETPIICGDYSYVDVSLGVMKSGVGSMSTQDMAVQVNDSRLFDLLKVAIDGGKLVKIRYNELRGLVLPTVGRNDVR